MTSVAPLTNGAVAPGFEAVREVFADVIGASPSTGSSFAAWHDGRLIADLWGGYADVGRTRPWTPTTLAMPYSVTKAFAATALLTLVSDGLVDLDARVSRYWPEFRTPATVRQVLSHSAGIVALSDLLPTAAWFDWDVICAALAAQEPAFTPGHGVGESAWFFGHLVGEIVRRVSGRTLGTVLRERVCGPHGLDFAVGLTASELARTADALWRPGFPPMDGRGPWHEAALTNPPGGYDNAVINSPAWRMAEIPAINGHGTASSVAGLYAALESGGLLPGSLVAEMASVQAEGFDVVMGDERAWGLGVVADDEGYGMGGLGGSLGWWANDGAYAIGFVTGDLADYQRQTDLENAVRAGLGLAPLLV